MNTAGGVLSTYKLNKNKIPLVCRASMHLTYISDMH